MFRDDVVYAVIVGTVLSEFNGLVCSCKRSDLQRPVVSRLIILDASLLNLPLKLVTTVPAVATGLVTLMFCQVEYWGCFRVFNHSTVCVVLV